MGPTEARALQRRVPEIYFVSRDEYQICLGEIRTM
jgi:hypothetical protein